MTALGATDEADRRRRDLARIHLAKKELALDDEAYRDLLWAIARVRSAADLDWTGRRRVLEHLRKLGAHFGARAGGHGEDKQARLVRWLWHRLRELGALHEGADDARALAAFVRRQTGKDVLAWLSTEEARGLIENLKQWVRRVERAHTEGGDAH